MEFYHRGRYYKEDELEEIEGLEQDDGIIRRQFIIKGQDGGVVFVEPIESKIFNKYGNYINTTSLKDAFAAMTRYAALLEEHQHQINDPMYEIKRELDEQFLRDLDIAYKRLGENK